MARDALHAPEAKQRGLFRSEFIEGLLAEPNQRRTPVNSNVLWQVALLEMWLQNHWSGLMSMLEELRQAVKQDFPAAVEELSELVSIPAMAWDAFDPGELNRAAAQVAALVRESGLADVAILQAPRPDGRPGAPAVVGRRPALPGKPTILLYAHYDVQPAGDLAFWQSPPFEAVERGGRLWGRGVADNKAGVLLHAAALRAVLRALGSELGAGVTVFIDGEEEAGSPSLPLLLQENPAPSLALSAAWLLWLGVVPRESVTFVRGVKLGHVGGQCLEVLHRPFAQALPEHLPAGILHLVHLLFALGCEPDRLRPAVQRVGFLDHQADAFKECDLPADGRLADTDAGCKFGEADGAALADHAEQSVGSRLHVRVDLARKLLGNGPGPSPEKTDLMLHVGQCRIKRVLEGGGGFGGFSGIAHDNHSRVRVRERLYRVRISDFWRLMDDEFGAGYSRVLGGSLVLAGVGGRTANQALAAGVSPRDIWLAVCDVQDVPEERRLGRDIKPRQHGPDLV
jgi:hypothetical protein